MNHINSNNIKLFLFASLLILVSTLYIFRSGLPQPGHWLILIFVFFYVGINYKEVFKKINDNRYVIYFLMWITVVNSWYYFAYGSIEFVVNTVYWIYNLAIFFTTLSLLGNEKFRAYVFISIWISFLLICTNYFLGYGGYDFWPRYNYFFNGPNQLAYYSLCLVLIALIINDVKLDPKFIGIFVLGSFVIVISGGRSGLLALFSMELVLVLLYLKGFLVASIRNLFTVIASPFLIMLVVNSACLPWYFPSSSMGGNVKITCGFDGYSNLSNDVQSRNVAGDIVKRLDALGLEVQDKKHSVITQLDARGYLRLIEYPEYILLGAGQGMDSRFGQKFDVAYEVHSSFVALLFYYGILGIILFIFMVYKICRSYHYLFIIAPVFVYGMFTYGLRAIYFWLLLAAIFWSSRRIGQLKV